MNLPWEAIITLFLAFIALVAWFVRLEAKSLASSAAITDLKIELASLKEKTDVMSSEIVKELTEIKVSLAKLEGALGVKK